MTDYNLRGNIIFENQLYPNDRMNEWIENYKSYLCSIDLVENEVIGILLRRGPDLICVMFALLQLNIPFLPLDIEQPIKRLEYMTEQVKMRFCITKKSYLWSLPGVKEIYMEDMSERAGKVMQKNSGLAYVLFTSGSTGMPKAVAVARKGLDNFMSGIPQVIPFSAGSRMACLTNHTFDIFFLESVLALNKNFDVILANESEQVNPSKMIRLIMDNKVNMLQITPSRLKLLEQYDDQLSFLREIEIILVGGEAFPQNLLGKMQKYRRLKIYNMYGPTETTIWSTVSDLTAKREVDIGRPIKNTHVYILNEKGIPADRGEIGEICISGDGLAVGYLNDREKTNNAFVDILLNGTEKIKVYKTGDIGSYGETGELKCFGRQDDQIKIRGHRVELGEIENCLSGMERIKMVLVCQEDDILTAYYVAEQFLENSAFRQYLKEKLPDYMHPSKYVKVEGFEYTSSGKIDRRKMSEKYRAIISDMEEQENWMEFILTLEERKNRIPEIICSMIGRILKIDSKSISEKDPLKDIGLNSIQYVNLIVMIENVFEFECDDEILEVDMFVSIADIGDYVKKMIGQKI